MKIGGRKKILRLRPANSQNSARGFRPGVFPQFSQLRPQRLLVFLQIIQQLRRHGPGGRRFGFGGMGARIANQPDFVLQLNHHDGGFLGIHLAEMLHEGGAGAGVGLLVGVAERRERFHRLAAFEPGSREPLLVVLHPGGRKAGEAVFPTAEPEENQMQIIFPRAGDRWQAFEENTFRGASDALPKPRDALVADVTGDKKTI